MRVALRYNPCMSIIPEIEPGNVEQILARAKETERGKGNSSAGRRIGIRPQSISRWLRQGYIPVDRVPAMEAITGIPRHVIRPDRPDLFPPPSINNAA